MTRLLLVIAAVLAQPALAGWEPSTIDGWQEIRFQGQTRYSQQPDCVLAQADGSALGELSFSGTPAAKLASGNVVTDALAQAVADATALAAAELVGLSQRAFEITLDYIKTREQFDKPIGSFQVIQHRAVDLNVACEVAQAGVREVLAQMDGETDPKIRARLASRAKARAVTAAKKITRDAIQLHGAVGYTDEFDIALYLNRALVLSAWLGDDAYHRRLWFEAREEEGSAQ